VALVEVLVDGRVAELSLNRPDARNALSIELCDAIAVGLDQIAADPEVRAVIVRGEGSVFCSGADFAAISGSGGVEFVPAFERMLESVARFRLPTVAAINGAALGGGFQLACVCDFRIAASDAKIGIPSARLGILVNFENIQRLVLLAGIARAKEVLMTARTYSGAEAAEAGLVTQAVSPDNLMTEAHGFASDLATRAPLSVQGTKRAIQAVTDHLGGVRNASPDEIAEIDRLVTEAYSSRDLQEGIAALSEKRDPSFEGL
jgi:enoyl-CoA hydratase/carnithine racemase